MGVCTCRLHPVWSFRVVHQQLREPRLSSPMVGTQALLTQTGLMPLAQPGVLSVGGRRTWRCCCRFCRLLRQTEALTDALHDLCVAPDTTPRANTEGMVI